MARPAPFTTGPRMLHPVAWWLWGLGLVTTAAHTTNPLLLLIVVLVAGWVVLERREVGAVNAYLPFLVLGLAGILLRIVLTSVLGGGVTGRTVLFRLPSVPLPGWFAGVRLGGPVTLEGVVASAVEGLRLAATLACLGAANALASPKRLLRYVPATLHDVGTAVVVALTYAPQLVTLAGRVRSARRLRGHSGRGLRELGRLVGPVLEGSLDRSLELAASMESRGYGRTPVRSARGRRVASGLTLLGLVAVVAGLYGVLDVSVTGGLGMPLLVAGVLLAGAVLVVGARRDVRSRYRRDPWSWPEWAVTALGLAPAGVLLWAEAHAWPGVLLRQSPLAWPEAPIVLVLVLLLPALAAVVSPTPPRLDALRRSRARRPGTPSSTVPAVAP
ncbi:MAG: energy-coupling factor transporter transmembrane component T [Lapillicoccus sp.]